MKTLVYTNKYKKHILTDIMREIQVNSHIAMRAVIFLREHKFIDELCDTKHYNTQNFTNTNKGKKQRFMQKHC